MIVTIRVIEGFRIEDILELETPKNIRIQSYITQFYENNKIMSIKLVNVEKMSAYAFRKSLTYQNCHIFVRAKRV